MSNTLVSKATVRGILCDICDRNDDVIEYITRPYYDDPEESPQDASAVRYIRLCVKCLETGIAVSKD
jgi:hypothetical protein